MAKGKTNSKTNQSRRTQNRRPKSANNSNIPPQKKETEFLGVTPNKFSDPNQFKFNKPNPTWFMNSVTQPVIKRLGYKGGCIGFTNGVYGAVRKMMRRFGGALLKNSLTIADSAGRKTLYEKDVYAANKLFNNVIAY